MQQVSLVERISPWGIASLECQHRSVFEGQLHGGDRRRGRRWVLRIPLRARTRQTTKGRATGGQTYAGATGFGFVARATQKVSTTDTRADRVSRTGAARGAKAQHGTRGGTAASTASSSCTATGTCGFQSGGTARVATA